MSRNKYEVKPETDTSDNDKDTPDKRSRKVNNGQKLDSISPPNNNADDLSITSAVTPRESNAKEGDSGSELTKGDNPQSGSKAVIQGEKEVMFLQRFVPKLVLVDFADDLRLLTTCKHTTFYAAVGFFDVSGFSTLADRLEKEEIQKTTSRRQQGGEGGENGPPGTGTGRKRYGIAESSRLESFQDNEHGGGSAYNRMASRQRSRVGGGSTSFAGNSSSSPGMQSHKQGLSDFDMIRKSAQKGSASERLTKYLNYILGNLIDIIGSHGGDIIKFAGDALVVVWKAQSAVEGLGFPCCRAGLCAVDAIDMAQTKLVNSDDAVLKHMGLHIGMGASEILGGHVGGIDNRWEYFTAGEATYQMSSAEGDAEIGEIVISPQVASYIRSCEPIDDMNGAMAAELNQAVLESLEFETEHLETGNEKLIKLKCGGLPEPPPVVYSMHPDMSKVLRGYVPGTVNHSLNEGTIETVGSLRKISVAFVNLLNLDVQVSDDPDALKEVHEVVRKVQEAAFHLTATLRQFIIDDKGTVAIVVIGLPPHGFHEDNAARAINFGLRLRQSGVSASVGVTTGTAFCGTVGNGVRAEYAVVGDVVNMSARLMGKAGKGEVLVDLQTKTEAENKFRFKESMRIKVKGKQDKISVFRPIGPAAPEVKAGGTMILGHEQSMAQIQAIYQQTHMPGGQKTILIEGERGTGKTELLRHACGAMQQSGCLVHISQGDSTEKHTSLFAWRYMLVSILEIDPNLAGFGAPIGLKGKEEGKEEGKEGAAAGGAGAGAGAGAGTLNKSASKIGGGDGKGMKRQKSLLPDDTMAGDPDMRSAALNSKVMQLVAVDSRMSKLFPLLNMILPVYFTDDKRLQKILATMSSQDKVQRLGQLMVTMLVASLKIKLKSQTLRGGLEEKGCGMCLVFDNAQWLDHNSWELISFVRAALPGALLMCSYRPFMDRNLNALQSLFKVDETVLKITMGRLTSAQTLMLLAQRFQIGRPHVELLAFLEDRGKGNPQDTIELMEELIEQKIIFIDKDTGEVDIKRNLQDLNLKISDHTSAPIIGQFDQLDRKTQLLLKAASVLGKDMNLDVLQYLYVTSLNASSNSQEDEDGAVKTDAAQNSKDAQDMFKRIETLQDINFMEKIGIGTLRFLDEKVRYVIYHMMLHSDRQKMHRRIVNWYVKNHSIEELRPYYIFLGRHCLYSEQFQLGLRFFERAAEQAIDDGNVEEAESCLNNILTILDEQGHALPEIVQILSETKLHLLRGQVAVLAQDWESAGMSLALAVDLSGLESQTKFENIVYQAHLRLGSGKLAMLRHCLPQKDKNVSAEDQMLLGYGRDARLLLKYVIKLQSKVDYFNLRLQQQNKLIVQVHFNLSKSLAQNTGPGGGGGGKKGGKVHAALAGAGGGGGKKRKSKGGDDFF